MHSVIPADYFEQNCLGFVCVLVALQEQSYRHSEDRLCPCCIAGCQGDRVSRTLSINLYNWMNTEEMEKQLRVSEWKGHQMLS